MSGPGCLASQQAVWAGGGRKEGASGRNGGRKVKALKEGWRECSVITMAPSGCWEAEITSDFEVRGSNTASVAIVTGSVCVCVCMRVCVCVCVCVCV